ncbi:MAG: sulfotransferase domain-containing protein, partial [Terriglobia bacterium]
RYEDLLADPCTALSRIAKFLNVDASDDRIRIAVDRSSADRMRKLEQEQSGHWGVVRNARKDIPFVREAKSRQWETALPPESILEIESAWGNMMQLLGYELSTTPQESTPLAASETAKTPG